MPLLVKFYLLLGIDVGMPTLLALNLVLMFTTMFVSFFGLWWLHRKITKQPQPVSMWALMLTVAINIGVLFSITGLENYMTSCRNEAVQIVTEAGNPYIDLYHVEFCKKRISIGSNEFADESVMGLFKGRK